MRMLKFLATILALCLLPLLWSPLCRAALPGTRPTAYSLSAPGAAGPGRGAMPQAAVRADGPAKRAFSGTHGHGRAGPFAFPPSAGPGGFPGDPSGRSSLSPGAPGLNGARQSPAASAQPSSRRSILNGRAPAGPYGPSSSLSGNSRETDVSGPSSGPEKPGVTGARALPAPLRFDRVLHACLYRDKRWLLPGQREYPAGQAIASLLPTFVTGAMSVTAGVTPDRRTIINWSGLRRAVRKQADGAAFDIVLDLRQYARPGDLVAQMARTASLLDAEAWTLMGASEAARRRPELLRAAVDEARRQGRKVGAYLDKGPLPQIRLDYILLYYEHGGAFPGYGASGIGGNGGPPVIVVAGSAHGPPGSGFARGITPAERRLMVMRAAKARKHGQVFAYPVFGPMSGPDQAYNALRDEFMMDTVRRGLRGQYAAGSIKSSK